ncbi:MAG: right-handed parallel beta-helix repeat-containing protein [bacterium]
MRIRPLFLGALISLLLSLALPCQARIIRVPLDFPTIQMGLNAAGDGDTVLVDHGTYQENITWPQKSGIKLFADEMHPPDSTFLEPEPISLIPIITIESQGSLIDSTTVIRGFVFRNGSAPDGGAILCTNAYPSIGDEICGNAFESNNADRYGGAIACQSALPIIKNNTFYNCQAQYGGGVGAWGRSYPSIRNNTFDSCSGDFGAAIYVSEAQVIGNGFRNCSGSGGAIHIRSGLSTLLEDNLIWENAAVGICCEGGSPTIRSSRILNNQRRGIYLDSGSEALIEDNRIEWNRGGGIESWESSPTIRGNWITYNSAHIGGAIYIEHGSPRIENNKIHYNQTDYEAAGIYCCGDQSIISRNSICFNVGVDPETLGGGLFACCNSHAIVSEDTIAENSPDGILIYQSAPHILDCVIENQFAGIRYSPWLEEMRAKADPAITQLDSTIVEFCKIRDNEYGILRRSEPLRVSWSSFSGNQVGVSSGGPTEADARYNCWGHPTGPGGAGPGQGDPITEYVLYYPWLANGTKVASSTRLDPTAYNNSRKIVRDECPPYYKLFYTNGDGVWVTMTSDPINGPWTDPIEIWPVEIEHRSTHPSVAIQYDPYSTPVPYSIIHLVWAEHIPDENAPGEVFYTYSKDGGFTWSEIFNLSNSPNVPSDYPSIAVDGTGIVHVVWQEHATLAPDIFYTNNSHGWIDPIPISTTLSLPSVFPTIASGYTYTYGTMPPLPPDDRVHIAWTEFTPSQTGVTPWIAYRSYDPIEGWIPPLEELPEDATRGYGGAFASIIAYPHSLGDRAAAVVWQWPYHDENPPTSPCDIWFNARYNGQWRSPVLVSPPDEYYPSWYATLSVQAGPFSPFLVGDTLWCAWEEWKVPEPGKSEIYSAYSPDCGETWNFYLNLSQTPSDQSRYPNLAYQKGVTFDGLYDIAWTEIPMDVSLQHTSDIYYIGATSLRDSIFAGVKPTEPTATSPIVAISYPNPATGKVTFAVSITKADRIELTIFDVKGREIAKLTNSETKAGTHFITWDTKDSNGRDVSPGIYWYIASGSQGSAKGKMVILR